jgi:1-acyl-sn-glycerol-3-phosphate acyltransferase
VVEAELDLLYTAEQVKSMSLDQLKQGLVDRISYDEFQWLEQRPKIRYHSRRMAEGLENILMLCPVCGGRHTIVTKKDRVLCEYCGYLTSVDQRYGFTGDFRFQNFGQWYHWQKEVLEKEIIGNADYTLSSRVELRLPGNGKGLTRHGGYGTCTLSRDGLTYAGTKDGETVQLHYSLQRIYRLLFGAGVNFEIYDGTEIRFFVPEDKRSAVDWYLASMILYDEANKPRT